MLSLLAVGCSYTGELKTGEAYSSQLPRVGPTPWSQGQLFPLKWREPHFREVLVEKLSSSEKLRKEHSCCSQHVGPVD